MPASSTNLSLSVQQSFLYVLLHKCSIVDYSTIDLGVHILSLQHDPDTAANFHSAPECQL